MNAENVPDKSRIPGAAVLPNSSAIKPDEALKTAARGLAGARRFPGIRD